MSNPVLVTGSEGLVGGALRESLEGRGHEIVGLDLRGTGGEHGDVRDPGRVREAVAGCRGVVHLAAVSRVIWAERAPDDCRSTNVGGLRRVLEAAFEQPAPPWVVFASSREVYGRLRCLPATEDAPLSPVNVYGRSKIEGERLVEEARACGLRAATVRLSNVYGSVLDHADRVVPAFARAAVEGSAIRVDGAECSFDFTHIDDTVRGMVAAMDRLEAGETLPPIHLLTGTPTTLRDLAAMATALAGKRVPVVEASPRPFDVSRLPRRSVAGAGIARLGAARPSSGRFRAARRRFSRPGRHHRIRDGGNMKILQVIHGYPMRYNAGSEVYTQTLCQGLAASHEVHVFTREEDPFAPDFRLRQERDPDDPRIALHVVNNPRNRDRYREPGIDQRFAEVLDRLRPDIVHVGHLNHLSTSLPSEAAKRSVPVVHTLHDYWPMCPRGQFMQTFSLDPEDPWAACDGQEDRKCAERCYARCFGGAPDEREADAVYWTGWVGRRMRHVREMTETVDRFIAPARYLLDRYRDGFGLPAGKLVLLDYGFDLARLGGRRERPEGRPFVFGYIGTHIPAKESST